MGRCLPGLSFLRSPLRALSVLALFLCSPLEPPPRGGTLARACPLAPQRPPLRWCVRALPGPAAGSEPSSGWHCPWEAESGGSRRKRSVFRAPLSFHGPLGGVVLPLAVRLREETTWGLKDYKSQHPPRRGRERQGCWAFLVLGGRRWELTKRTAGTAVPPRCQHVHMTPVGCAGCTSPCEALLSAAWRCSTACQRSQSAPVVEMG